MDLTLLSILAKHKNMKILPSIHERSIPSWYESISYSIMGEACRFVKQNIAHLPALFYIPQHDDLTQGCFAIQYNLNRTDLHEVKGNDLAAAGDAFIAC